ncbi:unnamed protein product [Cunninghamella blakesleeana]
MSVLPPQWVDIVDEVDEALIQIKDKTAIDRLTSDITDEFYRIKRDIQRIQADNGNNTEQDLKLARNIQTSLATKVQEISTSFRKQQSNYLQKLRGQESRKANILGIESGLSNEAADLLLDEDAQVGFTESQIAVLESSNASIDQREREINQIAKSIHQLAEIFRDLQTLVIDQGTILDRIDYNIEQTNIQVKDAVVQLDKGSKYQSKTRRRKLILLLILIILLLIVILVVKPRNH